MAEANGGSLEGRPTKMEQIQSQMQDALLVQATLQATESRLLKSHAEFTAKHERNMAEAEAHFRQQREVNAETDKRLAALISAIGELLRRT